MDYVLEGLSCKHLNDICEVYVIMWKIFRIDICKAVCRHVYAVWLKLCLKNKETKTSVQWI